MKRLTMIALALTLAHAASAEESYLLWMVDGTKTGDIQYDAVAVSAFTGDDAGSEGLYLNRVFYDDSERPGWHGGDGYGS